MTERNRRWQRLVVAIQDEYRRLSPVEKDWIAGRLIQIEGLQQQLDRLFQHAAGEQHCRTCLGDCCAKGHNHMTLANLLSFLQRGELPPAPDFNQTCPFLGERGCLLATSQRPYNCISFVCDIIENALTKTQLTEFYDLEQRLRQLYLGFAERYTGGGMTGLLLQAERLDGHPFLSLKQTANPVREPAYRSHP